MHKKKNSLNSNSKILISEKPSLGNIKGFDFNKSNNSKGLIIEASDSLSNKTESSGLYLDKDKLCIWSPGNGGNIMEVYDADSKNKIAFLKESGKWIQVSDSNKKENFLVIDNALERIRQFHGYQFNFKLAQEKIDKGRVIKPTYGFKAQEVETVMPYAVETDQDGNKYMDYDGIIPLLLQGIKSLDSINLSYYQMMVQTNNELNAYKNELNVLKSNVQNISSNISNSSEAVVAERAQLFQNNPNPFNNQTEISYYVPTNSVDSKIVIFDMTGALIKQVPISKLGKGSVILPASNLNAGMYYYTLMINNSEVDTKKMILLR